MIILAVATPLLFLGISYFAGNILAGEKLSKGTIRFSIFLSFYIPSLAAVAIYLLTLIDNSTSLKEHRTLVFGTLIGILGILMFIGYDAIIFEILKNIY